MGKINGVSVFCAETTFRDYHSNEELLQYESNYVLRRL